MAMTTSNPSSAYSNTLEHYSIIHAQGSITQQRINYENQKQQLYERTIRELESERREKRVRLEALDGILSHMQQQTHSLRDEISTGERFTTCFTMRSAIDQQDEGHDFRDDARRRDAIAAPKVSE